ncbi:MAG: ComF family protein [Calditrichaeota bacterium]|nr:ComF family protein [Calditrichota bacterium]
MQINPIKLAKGPWNDGFALDRYMKSSEFIGYDEYGNKQFDSHRTDLGELVYNLKYQNNLEVIPEIVEVYTTFIRSKTDWIFDLIIPIPSTKKATRLIAKGLNEKLEIPIAIDAVQQVTGVELAKNVELEDRRALVKRKYSVISEIVRERNILLIDDLYDSGATMKYIGEMLVKSGVKRLFALALTKTGGTR